METPKEQNMLIEQRRFKAGMAYANSKYCQECAKQECYNKQLQNQIDSMKADIKKVSNIKMEEEDQ